MTYQWAHQYQPLIDPRIPALQAWHQERGCPIPRPRSYSLNALGPNSSTLDLSAVTTKNRYLHPPSNTILPLSTGTNNYVDYTPPLHRTRHRSSSKRCHCNMMLFILLIASLVLGSLAAIRYRYFKQQQQYNADVLPMPLESDHRLKGSDQRPVYTPPIQPPQPQLPVNYNAPVPQQPYGVPPHYNQPLPRQQQQVAHQQQQQQQPPSQYLQQPQPVQYPDAQMYPYNHQYPHSYAPAGYNGAQQPQPYQQQQPQQQPSYQHQQQPLQAPPVPPEVNQMQNAHLWTDQRDYFHHGEAPARKPWILDHADVSESVPIREEPKYRQQQHHEQQQQQRYHQEQQPQPQPQPVKPELTRQEERAKTRNEARNSSGKASPRKSAMDDIWQDDGAVPETIDNEQSDLNEPKLILEPAIFSFREYSNLSDGTVILKSFEDDEEVTLEIVLE